MKHSPSTMIGKPKNFIFISDIHLFHNNVATTTLLDCLEEAIPLNASLDDVDAIFFGGDLFDQAVRLDARDLDRVVIWMGKLLSLCAEYNVVVRALEGTTSHDLKQNRLLGIVSNLVKADVDFKWVTDLSIERHDKLGIDILYVPDEWRTDNNVTWLEVKALLREKGLEKVDYCIMHGMFEYQLPKGIVFNHHLTKNYLSITRRYISIGHVHNFSRYLRIFAQGSPSTLTFGEIGLHGYVRVRDYGRADLKGDVVDFIPLKSGAHFEVFDLSNKDLSIDDVIKRMIEVEKPAHFKVIYPSDSKDIPRIRSLTYDFPNHRIVKERKKVEVTRNVGVSLGRKFKPVKLSGEELINQVDARLKERGEENTEPYLKDLKACAV